MRSLWLCAILLAAWPRLAAAKGIFGNENETIPLSASNPGALRGYYVRMSPLSLLHAGFGMGMPLNPRPAVPDPTLDTFGRTHYIIDISEGVQFGWNRTGNIEHASLLVTPQLGYTLMADNERLVHLGRLGLGVGYGNSWAAIHYIPRFVVGTSAGLFTVGARQSIAASFISNLLSAEVGHQLLYTASQIEHDLYFTISANLMIVIYVLSFMR